MKRDLGTLEAPHASHAVAGPLVIDAKPENASQAISFVVGFVDALGCSEDIKQQLAICVDEVFANIADYAYAPENNGKVEISVWTQNESRQVVVSLKDGGVAFNPLEHEDPDVSLDVEDRPIGGLGIFLVKGIADAVTYRRDGEYNILTFTKTLQSAGA